MVPVADVSIEEKHFATSVHLSIFFTLFNCDVSFPRMEDAGRFMS